MNHIFSWWIIQKIKPYLYVHVNTVLHLHEEMLKDKFTEKKKGCVVYLFF